MNADIETDEVGFLHNGSDNHINIDQENISEPPPSAQPEPSPEQEEDVSSEENQMENQESSIFTVPAQRRRGPRKMNWGDLKDLIFGAFVVVYLVVCRGHLPAFSIVWCVFQMIACYCQSHQYTKLFFRIFMSMWGLNAIISDSATLDQYVYVCINANEFWSLLPMMCMGIFSIFLMMCLSFSLFLYRITSLLSQLIFSAYDKYRYAQRIHQLSYSNISPQENIECSICLDNTGQVSTQECNHKFHPQCIKKWLSSHRTCPVCRKQLY